MAICCESTPEHPKEQGIVCALFCRRNKKIKVYTGNPLGTQPPNPSRAAVEEQQQRSGESNRSS